MMMMMMMMMMNINLEASIEFLHRLELKNRVQATKLLSRLLQQKQIRDQKQIMS